jgi:hypothetical protein
MLVTLVLTSGLGALLEDCGSADRNVRFRPTRIFTKELDTKQL